MSKLEKFDEYVYNKTTKTPTPNFFSVTTSGEGSLYLYTCIYSSKETKLEKIYCCSSKRKPFTHIGWWKDILFGHTKSAVRLWIEQPWLRWFSGVRCSVYFYYLCIDIPSGFLVTIVLPFPMNVAYLCLNLLCCGKGKGCPITCQVGIGVR